MKKSIVPTNASKVNAKQTERDIMFRYLKNRTTALNIKQQMWKVEVDQRKRERVYDTIKKRMELEKLGVSPTKLDKYFRLTPDNDTDVEKLDADDESNSSSESNE
jgi:hypothetical protein